MNIQTVLVDDNPSNFRGMLAALETLSGLVLDGENCTLELHTIHPVFLPGKKLDLDATIEKIGRWKPKVAIVDLRLEGDDPSDFSGVRLSAKLASRHGGCSVIIASSYLDQTPPGFLESLGELMQFVDRLQPAEQYERDLQDRLARAVEKHVRSMKDRHPVQPQKVIYISYAWGDEGETGSSREEIVDQLDKALLADGYDVRRDKRNLPYKASISKFMKDLGRGGCVVVVLSDKYLRSRSCMTELVELYRNRNFRKRIFPIVLVDAVIGTVTARAKYIKHWEAELKRMGDDIRNLGRPSKANISELYSYCEISENIGALLEFIHDMKYWTPPLVEADNFAVLKQSIDQRLRELGA